MGVFRTLLFVFHKSTSPGKMPAPHVAWLVVVDRPYANPNTAVVVHIISSVVWSRSKGAME